MFTLEVGMMVAFILAIGFSLWKLYAFMPSKPLQDDDTTPESTQELMRLMYSAIKAKKLNKDHIEAHMKMDSTFDEKHFWRFNANRLNKLLDQHFLENPEHKSIEDIHKALQKEK